MLDRPGVRLRRSCRYLDGSGQKLLEPRAESETELGDLQLSHPAGISARQNDEGIYPRLCTPLPFRRRLAFRRYGSARWFGRSIGMVPPYGGHVRYVDRRKSREPDSRL